jgi:hypothetical protein
MLATDESAAPVVRRIFDLSPRLDRTAIAGVRGWYGRVLDRRGDTVPNAVLEIWKTDRDGWCRSSRVRCHPGCRQVAGREPVALRGQPRQVASLSARLSLATAETTATETQPGL